MNLANCLYEFVLFFSELSSLGKDFLFGGNSMFCNSENILDKFFIFLNPVGSDIFL